MSPRIFLNAIQVRSKNTFFHGAIMLFFVICVVTTFIIGIEGLSKLVNADKDN
jgi:hypothetical protein